MAKPNDRGTSPEKSATNVVAPKQPSGAPDINGMDISSLKQFVEDNVPKLPAAKQHEFGPKKPNTKAAKSAWVAFAKLVHATIPEGKVQWSRGTHTHMHLATRKCMHSWLDVFAKRAAANTLIVSVHGYPCVHMPPSLHVG